MKGTTEVRLRYITFGLRESRKRFHEYLKDTDKQNSSSTVSALTELLMWISISNEWHFRNNNAEKSYQNRKTNDSDGQCVEGLRYVFNTLKHDMSFIKLIKTSGEIPVTDNLYFENYSTDSVWVKADGVIEYNENYKDERAFYQTYIEGRKVVETVDNAYKFLIAEYDKVK